MNKVALFVRHTAKPGQREKIKAVWSSFVKPRVEENEAHELYYFCYDNKNEDVVSVFQLFSSQKSMEQFMAGNWYPEYLRQVSNLISEEPFICDATPIWNKAWPNQTS